MEEKVDILLATYNTNTTFLIKQLDSILNQTYNNFNLLISDDNSTDSKLIDILKNYKNSYILKNPLNLYNVTEQRLDNILEKLVNCINNKIEREKPIVSNLKEKLRGDMKYYFEKRVNSLNNIKIKLDLLNPDNILKKGYSVTLVNGKIIKSVNDIKIKDKLVTKFADGNVVSNVEEVN